MQNKFSTRSNELELLDAPDIPQQLLFQNLRELAVINKLLGGHSISLSGIKELLSDKNKVYHIVDIGCGGGDAILEICSWAGKNGFKLKVTGVDMNKDCIEFMTEYCKGLSGVQGCVMDYRDFLKMNNDIDIIHCSLFCHHLTDTELKELFTFMREHSRVGFVINDLQRHWFAYYSIYILTRALGGSKLVKNDAPLSVRRGFRKPELRSILDSSGAGNARVQWKWAFRYLVLYDKRS
jgi:2-polyprenyl-3-methyl-5-hydroxy-6-metoxy-1,4-benzoquinol methylase